MDAQMRAILVAETVQQDDLLGKKVICVLDYSGVQLSFLIKLNIFALQKAYKTWRVCTTSILLRFKNQTCKFLLLFFL